MRVGRQSGPPPPAFAGAKGSAWWGYADEAAPGLHLPLGGDTQSQGPGLENPGKASCLAWGVQTLAKNSQSGGG